MAQIAMSRKNFCGVVRSYAKFWGDLRRFLAILGAICEEPAKVRVPPPEIPAVVFLFSRKYYIDLANNALYNIYIELGELKYGKNHRCNFRYRRPKVQNV